MTPELAKQICINAHKGQWRKPTTFKIPEQGTLEGINKYIAPNLLNCNYTVYKGNKYSYNADNILQVQQPYVNHPIAVADMLSTDKEKILAYLHDVIEDTNITYDELYKLGLNECDDDVLNALKLLTKQPQQEYSLYIFNISCCRLARKVKIADMFHNMSTSTSEKQKARYLKYIPILLNNL